MRTQPLSLLSKEETKSLAEWASSLLQGDSDFGVLLLKNLSQKDFPDILKGLPQKARLSFDLGSQEENPFYPHSLHRVKPRDFVPLSQHTAKEDEDDQNVLILIPLSTPEGGGSLIYRDTITPMTPGSAHLVQADQYYHGTTPVLGEKPLLYLRLGFTYREAHAWMRML